MFGKALTIEQYNGLRRGDRVMNRQTGGIFIVFERTAGRYGVAPALWATPAAGGHSQPLPRSITAYAARERLRLKRVRLRLKEVER